MRDGHKYSWLVRLINFGMSWAVPVDIERIDTEATDTKVATVQVQELDVHDPEAKVVVADSRYEEHRFLGIFKHLKHTFGLIRLHSNRVLYEAPQEKPKGSRGAPRKHGRPFQLNSAHRVPKIKVRYFNLGNKPCGCVPGINCTSRNWRL